MRPRRSEILTNQTGQKWCPCPDSPTGAKGPLTLLDHASECGFPVERCDIDDHRRVVHESCGLVVPVRLLHVRHPRRVGSPSTRLGLLGALCVRLADASLVRG